MESKAIHFSPTRTKRSKEINSAEYERSGGKSKNIEKVYPTYEVDYKGTKHTLTIKTGTLVGSIAPFSVKVQNKNIGI